MGAVCSGTRDAEVASGIHRRGEVRGVRQAIPVPEPGAGCRRYDAAAEKLGLSSGALRMAVHRMRKRFAKLLRAEIAATVSDPKQTDDEVRFLMATLSS